MKKTLFFVLINFLLMSCSGSIIHVTNDGNPAVDSLLLIREDSTIKIFVGEQLNNRPTVSQFIDNGDKGSHYVLLDNDALHRFDVSTGKLLSSQKIEGCGFLNNYSGFLCVNDTTFVYYYKENIVYMLDSLLIVQKSWSLKGSLDAEAVNHSPILYSNGSIVLSGAKLGQQTDPKIKSPRSCRISLSDGDIVYGVEYPKQYMEGNFGGVNFNTVYHSLDKDGNVLYSFPADHYVYAYSPDFSTYRKIYMGSRYTPKITSSDKNALELFMNKELTVKYYVNQHSYSNILYDRYRKVYYRIAQHPLSDWGQGLFTKPFSILVMNSDGNLISETPILEDYGDLGSHNIHVTRDGLLIQKETDNENIIEFVNYKIAGNEK